MKKITILLVSLLLLCIHTMAQQHQWSKIFGPTTQNVYINDIEKDATGNVYITGQTATTPFIDFGGGNLNAIGTFDIFVVSFDINGNHRWSRRVGATSGTYNATAITIDNSGNVFVGGILNTNGPLLNLGAGFTVNVDGSGEDTFLWKLSAANGTTLGAINMHTTNTSGDMLYDLLIDKTGDLIVTGFYANNNGGAANCHSLAGSQGIYIAQYNTSLGCLNIKKNIATSINVFYDIKMAIDENNEIILLGTLNGTLDFGGGAIVSDGEDVCIIKYDNTFNHKNSQKFFATGGTSQKAKDISVDAANYIYITGYTTGTVDLLGGFLPVFGLEDVFMAKYIYAAGNLHHAWSKIMGGSNSDKGIAIGTDVVSNIYLTGATFGNNINLGGGNYAGTSSEDVFLTVYDSAGRYINQRFFATPTIEYPKEITVTSQSRCFLAVQAVNSIDMGGGTLNNIGGGEDIVIASYTYSPAIALEYVPTTSSITNGGTVSVGTTAVGTPMTGINILLKNTSLQDALSLSNAPYYLVITGNTNDFTIDESAITQSRLAPNTQVNIGVTFNPLSAGTKSITITIINSDHLNTPFSFTLQGVGFVPTAPEFELSVGGVVINNGSTFMVGNTTLGTTTTTTFTLKNIGNSNLDLVGTPNLNITSTNPNFNIAPTSLPSPIASAGSASFTVTYAPSAITSDNMSILITNNDSDESIFTLNLQGNGIKNSQTINTPILLIRKVVGDAPFIINANSSSGLPITFSSSQPNVATVTGNVVTIIGGGTTSIILSQSGNALYDAAPSVTIFLEVSFVASPNNIQVTPASENAIRVIWKDNTSIEDGYEIERAIGQPTNFVKIQNNIANQNEFIDTQVSLGVVYFYRVRAIYRGIYSDYSEIQGCVLAESYFWITALEDEIQTENHRLYPNPNSTGVFFIKDANTLEGQKMDIYNTDGQLVKTTFVQNACLHVENLSNGIYWVVWEEKGKKKTCKIYQMR